MRPPPPEAFVLALASAMWNPGEPDLAAVRMAPVLRWTLDETHACVMAHWEQLQQMLDDGFDEELLEAADQCSRADVADFARRFDASGTDLKKRNAKYPAAVGAGFKLIYEHSGRRVLREPLF